MKSMGVMFRKIDKSANNRITNPNRELLKKQVKTLHRKLKKKDDITTYYVIESDTNKGGKYHTHLLIKYNNQENLYNGLSRFIGGTTWEEKDWGLDTLKTCKGTFGEVDVHPIHDEVEFMRYMDKKEMIEKPLI
ncbi:hypothetical protein K1F50_18780 [Muricauda oceani]|nr:hypothetical protein [Allomuricauda oceani]MBW8244860.1 hypothetical protein [Allomuricauda oceani]